MNPRHFAFFVVLAAKLAAGLLFLTAFLLSYFTPTLASLREGIVILLPPFLAIIVVLLLTGLGMAGLGRIKSSDNVRRD